MPSKEFSDTLAETMGPGVTITLGGDVFGGDHGDPSALDLARMNAEIEGIGHEIEFVPSDPPKEDVAYEFYKQNHAPHS